MKEIVPAFIGYYGDNLLRIRDYYVDAISREVEDVGSEQDLPFASRAMYECWIDYCSHFFEEFYCLVDELEAKGFSDALIASCVGSPARLVRVITQLLLPGACVNKNIEEGERHRFINRFVERIMPFMIEEKCPEFDPNLLFVPEKISEERKISIARLTSALEEACEAIYMGDQNIGYVSYGIDKSFFPDHYLVHQDFDLNLGRERFSDLGKFGSYTIYPQHYETDNPFTIITSPTTGRVFHHGFFMERKWRQGRPHLAYLSNGYLTCAGRNLRASEMDEMAEKLRWVVSGIEKKRAGLSEYEHKLEYCEIQASPLKAMSNLLGREWKLNADVMNSMQTRVTTNELRRIWGDGSAVKISRKLIDEAIIWSEGA